MCLISRPRKERKKIRSEDERGMEFISWKIGFNWQRPNDGEERSFKNFFSFYKDFTKRLALSKRLKHSSVVFTNRKEKRKKFIALERWTLLSNQLFFSIDHPSPKMKHTRCTGFLRRPQVHLRFVRTRRGGVRRCRRRRGEEEDNEKKTRQEPRSFSSMHAL